MSRPPVFRSEQGPWSIGSEVVGFWWSKSVEPDGTTRWTEHHGVGIVSRLHKATAGGAWRATVAWDRSFVPGRPDEFDPGELLAAAPYDPEESLKAWERIGR